jgi:hypothetical protein
MRGLLVCISWICGHVYRNLHHQKTINTEIIDVKPGHWVTASAVEAVLPRAWDSSRLPRGSATSRNKHGEWRLASEPQELGQKRVRTHPTPNLPPHTTLPASRVNAFTAPQSPLRELPDAEMPLHNTLPCILLGVCCSQGRPKTTQAFDAGSRRQYLDTSFGIPQL